MSTLPPLHFPFPLPLSFPSFQALSFPSPSLPLLLKVGLLSPLNPGRGGLGERTVSSPSGVWGGATAEIEFDAF